MFRKPNPGKPSWQLVLPALLFFLAGTLLPGLCYSLWGGGVFHTSRRYLVHPACRRRDTCIFTVGFSCNSCLHPGSFIIQAGRGSWSIQLSATRGHWIITHDCEGDVKRPIFGMDGGAIALDSKTPPLTKKPVSGVPGAYLFGNSLTRDECKRFVEIAEELGFMGYSPRGDTTLLNCQIMVSDDVLQQIFRRFAKHIPVGMRGRSAIGFNGRWRVYKYCVNDTFTPHVDGGWPYQGLNLETGGITQLMTPETYSQMTCLVYLNDDFTGGNTTFFQYDWKTKWKISAQVPPTTGMALCFFHGDHPDSPRHEGSPVLHGVKYVIQTDLIFSSPPKPGVGPSPQRATASSLLLNDCNADR